MSYCPNCGKKRNEFENFCEACGYSFTPTNKIEEKDKKIQSLEEKIIQLEKILDERKNDSNTDSNPSPWIFITPILFFIVFFGFVFLIIVFS